MKQPGEILAALENSKMWLHRLQVEQVLENRTISPVVLVNRLFGICDELMCSDFLIENQSPRLKSFAQLFVNLPPLTYHPQE